MCPRASVTRTPLGTGFSLFPVLISPCFQLYINTKTNSISLFTLAANFLTPIGLDESVIAYRSQTGFMEAVNILKYSTIFFALLKMLQLPL